MQDAALIRNNVLLRVLFVFQEAVAATDASVLQ